MTNSLWFIVIATYLIMMWYFPGYEPFVRGKDYWFNVAVNHFYLFILIGNFFLVKYLIKRGKINGKTNKDN